MAQKGVQLDRESFHCSICSKRPKAPVTVTCGHSFCKSCIQSHWDKEDEKKIYSCPQCRQTFMSRPVPQKNALLAGLVEEPKKSGLEAAPDVPSDAGPEDVAPDTVSAAVERTERQRDLEESRENIQQRIQDREEDVRLLEQEVEALNGSADRAVEHSQEIFSQLIRLMQQRRSDVEQQVRSQQEREVSRVRELQEKLDQEITELKRKDADLLKLSPTEDHNQSLNSSPSLSGSGQPADSSRINIRPQRYFEEVIAAVSTVRDNLQDLLTETWTDVSQAVTEVSVSLSEPPEPEPRTRADFLRYSQTITLDPNTANTHLLLSRGNRRATVTEQRQPYPDHFDRFNYYYQVLSRERLTGRCYWEVERRGGLVWVAVAYNTIGRARATWDCRFGKNDNSWMLLCYSDSCEFMHNKVSTDIQGPRSSRVGVYLDYEAGILSFYSVSETNEMTLLHEVQTTFTEPLHAGLWLPWSDGESAEFSKL